MSNAAAPHAPAIARRFGKCPRKGCTTKLVLDPATDARVRVDANGNVNVDAAPRTPLGDNALVGPHGMVYCATPHEVYGGTTLEFIKWSGVKAKVTHTECDTRCQDSRSAICKCSCGGARHGETA